MAIVGCGNFHYSSKLQVPLSSVDQRSRQIGERAAKMIMTLLEKPPSARRAASSWSRADRKSVVAAPVSPRSNPVFECSQYK